MAMIRCEGGATLPNTIELGVYCSASGGASGSSKLSGDMLLALGYTKIKCVSIDSGTPTPGISLGGGTWQSAPINTEFNIVSGTLAIQATNSGWCNFEIS